MLSEAVIVSVIAATSLLQDSAQYWKNISISQFIFTQEIHYLLEINKLTFHQIDIVLKRYWISGLKEEMKIRSDLWKLINPRKLLLRKIWLLRFDSWPSDAKKINLNHVHTVGAQISSETTILPELFSVLSWRLLSTWTR